MKMDQRTVSRFFMKSNSYWLTFKVDCEWLIRINFNKFLILNEQRF